MIAPESLVKRALDARVRRVGGTQMVARGQEVMELNEVAAIIWKLADGSRSVADISAAVVAEYEVSPEEALTDVSDFVTDMVSAGFLTAREPA